MSCGLRGLLLAGTIMVTYGDAKQGDSSQLNTVGGDLLVLLSGLCYAAYTVEQHHLLLHIIQYSWSHPAQRFRRGSISC